MAHADQNINLNLGCENSYQGILYVWDSTKNNTSNTVILPKSHKKHYKKLLTATPKSFGTEVAYLYTSQIFLMKILKKNYLMIGK